MKKNLEEYVMGFVYTGSMIIIGYAVIRFTIRMVG